MVELPNSLLSFYLNKTNHDDERNLENDSADSHQHSHGYRHHARREQLWHGVSGKTGKAKQSWSVYSINKLREYRKGTPSVLFVIALLGLLEYCKRIG